VAKGSPGTAIAYAEAQLGKPYVWGGSGPGSFDCSGLTMRAFQAAGYTMPHNAAAQLAQTARFKIKKSTSPPAGALVFFGPGVPVHVGLSVGGGRMIEAPHRGASVKYYSIADEATLLGLIAATAPLGTVGTPMTAPTGYSETVTDTLARLDAPQTTANVSFLNAWARREGGYDYNFWNSKQTEPGAGTEADGFPAYTGPKQGAGAFYATLTNGNYPDIVAALRKGNPSLTKNYNGLKVWSAGGVNAPGGYYNLAGIPTTPPGGANTGAQGASSSSAGNTAGTSTTADTGAGAATGCQHPVSLTKLGGTICMDKAIGGLAMAGGVVVIFGGVAVLLVAGFAGTKVGKGAIEAAAVVPGVAGAVGKTVAAGQRARPAARSQARTVRAQSAAGAEAKRLAPVRAEQRRSEAHVQRQAQSRTRHRRAGTVAAQRVRHREDTHTDRRLNQSASRVKAKTGRGKSYPGLGYEPAPRRPRPTVRPLPAEAPF
jgi:NlpC/P60 family